MEFGNGLSQREICAHFNEGKLAQVGWSPKNKELWNYVASFEFSRPKVAQAAGIYCFFNTYFRDHIHLRCKHAVVGRHLSYQG